MDESVRFFEKWLPLDMVFWTKHVALMKSELLINEVMLKMKFYPILTIRSNFIAGDPKYRRLCYLLYLL